MIQTQHRIGALDTTAASQAVEDLRLWPGERWSHRVLLPRAWELRHDVRGYDAIYVALAEALGATLLTLDRRLERGDRSALPHRELDLTHLRARAASSSSWAIRSTAQEALDVPRADVVVEHAEGAC